MYTEIFFFQNYVDLATLKIIVLLLSYIVCSVVTHWTTKQNAQVLDILLKHCTMENSYLTNKCKYFHGK